MIGSVRKKPRTALGCIGAHGNVPPTGHLALASLFSWEVILGEKRKDFLKP